MNRNQIQEEALQAWLPTKKGTAEIATGVGKTWLFLKACLVTEGRKIFLAERKLREDALRKNIQQFAEIDKKILDVEIEFNTYQTAHKWKGEHFGLVGADEIHDSLTPTYSSFYKNNTYDALMGLTATTDRTVEYDGYTKGDILDKYAPVVYSYSLTDSVKNGTSKPLDIIVVNSRLDSTVKNIEAGSKTKKFMTTEWENYIYWDKAFKKAAMLKNRGVKSAEFQMRYAIRKRLECLHTSNTKHEVAKKIIKDTKRLLIFGNSLPALEKLTPNTVSGERKDSPQVIEAFERGEIENIASFKLLTQGANIEGVQNILMHSYYGKTLPMIQRLGRLRLSPGKSKVYVLRTLYTQEEKWFDKSMIDLNVYNVTEVNGYR